MTDEGWTAAARLAREDSGASESKSSLRLLVPLAVVFGGCGALGVGTFIYVMLNRDLYDPGAGPDAETRPSFVTLALLILGIAGFVVVLIWGLRTGHLIPRWTHAVSALSAPTRKSVRRQIAGKEPVDPDHLETIVAIARQSRKTALGEVLLFSPVMLFSAQSVLLRGSTVSIVSLALVLVGLAIAGVRALAVYRSAGGFIDTHAPADPVISPSR